MQSQGCALREKLCASIYSEAGGNKDSVDAVISRYESVEDEYAEKDSTVKVCFTTCGCIGYRSGVRSFDHIYPAQTRDPIYPMNSKEGLTTVLYRYDQMMKSDSGSPCEGNPPSAGFHWS